MANEWTDNAVQLQSLPDLIPKFRNLFQTERGAFNRLEKEDLSVRRSRILSRCSALNLNFIHAPPDLFSTSTSGPAFQGYSDYNLLWDTLAANQSSLSLTGFCHDFHSQTPPFYNVINHTIPLIGIRCRIARISFVLFLCPSLVYLGRDLKGE